VLAYSFNYSFFFKFYLPGIVVWQMTSWLVHLLIRSRYKLKKERIIWVVAVVLGVVTFYVMRANIHEARLKELASTEYMSVPAYELVFVIIQSFFSFWYFTIVVREIKHVVKRKLG
jgi:ABC-type Mn2+/Zn2+ transport system permease subunit